MLTQFFKILGVIVACGLIIMGLYITRIVVIDDLMGKQRYKTHHELLVKNWETNREAILSLKEEIERLSIIENYEFLDKERFSLSIAPKIAKETQQMLWEKGETIWGDDYEFDGKDDEQKYALLYKNTKLTKQDLIHLNDLIKEADCIGFHKSTINKSISILHSGHSFVGGFNYLFTDSIHVCRYENGVTNRNYKLAENVYASYQQSGLYCGKPYFIIP